MRHVPVPRTVSAKAATVVEVTIRQPTVARPITITGREVLRTALSTIVEQRNRIARVRHGARAMIVTTRAAAVATVHRLRLHPATHRQRTVRRGAWGPGQAEDPAEDTKRTRA